MPERRRQQAPQMPLMNPYIYSTDYNFAPQTSGQSTQFALQPQRQQAATRLQQSLGFRQAGREGRERMMRAVSMGLPSTTDISRVEQVGIGATGQPMYRAPRPMPFGSYSGFGKREEQPFATPSLPAGGPQPAQGMTPPPIVPERSLGMSAEGPMAFTGFGRNIGEAPYPTATIPKITPSPLPKSTTPSLTSFAGIPRFPVREESFLNRTR